MKKTQWFSAIETPPARVGWYQCRNSDDACEYANLRYWNGKQWSAMNRRDLSSLFGERFPSNQWRGLAKKP